MNLIFGLAGLCVMNFAEQSLTLEKLEARFLVSLCQPRASWFSITLRALRKNDARASHDPARDCKWTFTNNRLETKGRSFSFSFTTGRGTGNATTLCLGRFFVFSVFLSSSSSSNLLLSFFNLIEPISVLPKPPV